MEWDLALPHGFARLEAFRNLDLSEAGLGDDARLPALEKLGECPVLDETPAAAPNWNVEALIPLGCMC